ncbi:MAG: hypothetical protein ACYCOU_21070, partial [Sulfobacillus sp.]
PWGEHPRLQLLTVAELLAGVTVDAPKTTGVNHTYKQAPRHQEKPTESIGLFEGYLAVPEPAKKGRRKK